MFEIICETAKRNCSFRKKKPSLILFFAIENPMEAQFSNAQNTAGQSMDSFPIIVSNSPRPLEIAPTNGPLITEAKFTVGWA